MSNFTLRDELVKCGRKGCKSCPHGPYRYAYWSERGRTRKMYIGKIGTPACKFFDEVMPRFELEDDVQVAPILALIWKLARRSYSSMRGRYRAAGNVLKLAGDLDGVAHLRSLWHAAWPGKH